MSHGSYDLNLGSKRLILAGDIRLRSWPDIGDSYGMYRVGSVNDLQKPPVTCRKPLQPVYITKNLPETCRKPTGNLRGGFRRFPDNPSLTDRRKLVLRIKILKISNVEHFFFASYHFLHLFFYMYLHFLTD
jgi:hypothetical protein